MTDILFYGWYNQGNYGDEWFKQTFQKLFYGLRLEFSFDLKKVSEQKYKYLIVGGGNILHRELADVLKHVDRPFEFWSISLSHANEKKFLANSKRVILRDSESYDIVKEEHDNVILLPDINFLNPPYVLNGKRNPTDLIFIPNSNVVPRNNSSISKFQEYQRFCVETSRFLDEYKKPTSFYPLQRTRQHNDSHVYHNINSYSLNRKFDEVTNEDEIINRIENSKYLISMRYHGMVLGIIYNIPTICIGFHSKLKRFCKDFEIPYIDYYEFSKNKILTSLNEVQYERSEKVNQFLERTGEYNELSKLIRNEIS